MFYYLIIAAIIILFIYRKYTKRVKHSSRDRHTTVSATFDKVHAALIEERTEENFSPSTVNTQPSTHDEMNSFILQVRERVNHCIGEKTGFATASSSHAVADSSNNINEDCSTTDHSASSSTSVIVPLEKECTSLGPLDDQLDELMASVDTRNMLATLDGYDIPEDPDDIDEDDILSQENMLEQSSNLFDFLRRRQTNPIMQKAVESISHMCLDIQRQSVEAVTEDLDPEEREDSRKYTGFMYRVFMDMLDQQLADSQVKRVSFAQFMARTPPHLNKDEMIASEDADKYQQWRTREQNESKEVELYSDSDGSDEEINDEELDKIFATYKSNHGSN